MRRLGLVWAELKHRRSQLVSGVLAITLGIAVIVAIHSVTVVSEKAVAINLDNLGANILVLPQAANVDDYYAADIDAPTMPEDYVDRVVTSGLPGVDNISPKLTRRIQIGVHRVVLTGILPAQEIASKPVWQQSGLMGAALELSCDPDSDANQSHGYEDERLQRKVIDELPADECLLGSDAAVRLGLAEGDSLTVGESTLRVARVLEETGTVDDGRVFTHLHTVQKLLGAEDQISAIEVMGCCNAISDGLLSELRNVLPDTRITTVKQIVSTQIETNSLMRRISLTFLAIVLFVGAVSIGNFMWANVNERRREIGILRLLGAPRGSIYGMLLAKAAILGLLGGAFGFALGSIAATQLGPQFVRMPVAVLWLLLPIACGLSVLVAVFGAAVPAWIAGRLEPVTNMQEV
jgi:putative ABC transport system permease protein